MKQLLNTILTPFKMIWGIFDHDAHRIVSKKGLNLIAMEDKLDKQLAKETTESLTDFIESKKGDVNELAELEWKNYKQRTGFPPHMYTIGFEEAYNKAKKTLYTKEELLKAMEFARTFSSAMKDEDFIQTLKQK